MKKSCNVQVYSLVYDYVMNDEEIEYFNKSWYLPMNMVMNIVYESNVTSIQFHIDMTCFFSLSTHPTKIVVKYPLI